MRKSLLFKAIMLLITLFAATTANADYCVTDATFGTTERYLTTITLSDDENEGSITVGQTTTYGESVYFDKTAQSVTLKTGVEITPTIVWSGAWMHGYLYVDFNGDEVFTPQLNDDGTPTDDSELIAFSSYNIGTTSEVWVNHKGESTTGSTNPTETPTFYLPNLAPGEYRARFNVDWESIDPCGTTNIGTNAGSITDFIIVVAGETSERTITVVSSNTALGTVSGGGTATGGIVCTAAANDNAVFVNWTDELGEIISTSEEYIDNKAGDKTLTANFAQLFTITAVAGENGTITPTTQTVASGSEATFEITPDATYKIETITLDGVDITAQIDGSVSSGGTVTIEVTAASQISGTFTPRCQEGAITAPYIETFDTDASLDCWTIINANQDNCTWAYNSGVLRYLYNATQAANDWAITPQIVVTENSKLIYDIWAHSASYPEQYSVYVLTSPTDIDNAVQILASTEVSNTEAETKMIDISAYVGEEVYFAFKCESEADRYYLYLDNVSVEEPTYTVTATVYGEGTVSIDGSTAATTQTAEIAQGNSTTLTAYPNDGYIFLYWTNEYGNEVSSSSTYTLSPTTHRTITATFGLAAARTITLNVNDASLGSVSFTSPASTETVLYTQQENVRATTASIDDDSFFVNWTKDGEIYSETESITYSGVPDVTLTANYVLCYTVTTVKGAGGDVTLTSGGETITSGTRILKGETVNLFITFDTGRVIDQILVNGTDVTSQYNNTTGYDIEITTTTTITISFKYPDVIVEYTSTGAGYIEVWSEDDGNPAGTQYASGDGALYGAPMYIFPFTYGDGELVSLYVNGVDEYDTYIDGLNYGYLSVEIYPKVDVVIEANFTGTSTGIEDATTATPKIYGTAGAIVIEGAGTATIYTLTGTLAKTVQVNGSSSVAMPQGVYVVVVDATSSKVVVQP